MARLPLLLIYSRLLIGFVIVVFSIPNVAYYPLLAIILLTLGLLTDIFDGIIARRLNVSSEKLRRLDSGVDQAFFISVSVATYIRCPEFFQTHTTMLIILLGSEGLIYLVSFIKFKKEVATHSIGAKFWTLLLFATLVQLTWQCESGILFSLCFWIGLLTRLEIIAIILILKTWTNDVPSVYHAWKIRQGKEVKRHKLFNG